MRDKVRWVRMSQFGTFQYKHSFSDEEEWKTAVICRQAMDAVQEPILNLLPAAANPIAPAKLNDIKKQMKFVPSIYHGLYDGLTARNETASTVEENSVDQAESMLEMAVNSTSRQTAGDMMTSTRSRKSATSKTQLTAGKITVSRKSRITGTSQSTALASVKVCLSVTAIVMLILCVTMITYSLVTELSYCIFVRKPLNKYEYLYGATLTSLTVTKVHRVSLDLSK